MLDEEWNKIREIIFFFLFLNEQKKNSYEILFIRKLKDSGLHCRFELDDNLTPCQIEYLKEKLKSWAKSQINNLEKFLRIFLKVTYFDVLYYENGRH